VLEALATGTLPRERYDGFLKLPTRNPLPAQSGKARRMAKPKEKRSRSPARVQRGRLNWFFFAAHYDLAEGRRVRAPGGARQSYDENCCFFCHNRGFNSGICATMGREFSVVNISSAIFDCSAPDLDSCPDESLPEFAFIGRSNVGKSSLLNMLAGEQGLARVSPTPGFTKLINVFTMNKCWRLVDLPGDTASRAVRRRIGSGSTEP